MSSHRDEDVFDLLFHTKLKAAVPETPNDILILSSRSLTKLQNDFYRLCKLRKKGTIVLNNNYLMNLKEGGNMEELEAVRSIHLSSNWLAELPSDIRFLTNLKILILNDNRLASLPDEIGEMKSLEQLSLSKNYLSSLPESIGNLKNLVYLDVSNNKDLHNFPLSMYKNKKLNKLYFDIEAGWNVPVDVLNEGITGILPYLAKESGVQEYKIDFNTEIPDYLQTRPQLMSMVRMKFKPDSVLASLKKKEEQAVTTVPSPTPEDQGLEEAEGDQADTTVPSPKPEDQVNEGLEETEGAQAVTTAPSPKPEDQSLEETEGAKAVTTVLSRKSEDQGLQGKEGAQAVTTVPSPKPEDHCSQNSYKKLAQFFQQRNLETERRKCELMKGEQAEQSVIDRILKENDARRKKLLEGLAENTKSGNTDVLKPIKHIDCVLKKRDDLTMTTDGNSYNTASSYPTGNTDHVVERILKINDEQKRKRLEILISTTAELDQNRRETILESMKNAIVEEYSFLPENMDYKPSAAKMNSILQQELNKNNKILELLTKRDEKQQRLLEALKEDQELQSAAVLMLLEKADSRNAEYNAQVAFIAGQLSKITTIERTDKDWRMYNCLDNCAERRVKLVDLLMSVLAEKSDRRKQLLEKLKEAQAYRDGDDMFWFAQYQNIMDQCPEAPTVYPVNPILMYTMIMGGVGHCKSNLEKLDLSTWKKLEEVTEEVLFEAGIQSSEDQKLVLKAIRKFIDSKFSGEEMAMDVPIASAPPAELIDQQQDISAPPMEECMELAWTGSVIKIRDSYAQKSDSLWINEIWNSHSAVFVEGECVICLSEVARTIFVPCGHLCCCVPCSDLMELCPMCRQSIQVKIPSHSS